MEVIPGQGVRIETACAFIQGIFGVGGETWGSIAMVAEHPEDPVVRVTLRDSDDHRLVFNIALESTPQPDDDIQDWEGLMVAVDKHTSGRMEGVTLDYADAGGFKFLHPPQDHNGFQRLNMN